MTDGVKGAPGAQRTGGVKYTHAAEGYFEKRQLQAHRRLLGTVGHRCRRGHLRATSRGGTSASARPAGAACSIATRGHRRHVLRDAVLDRRDVGGDAAHGRRLLVRPLGDGAVGRVRHRPGRDHRVRLHHRRDRATSPPATPTPRPTSCSGSTCPTTCGSGGWCCTSPSSALNSRGRGDLVQVRDRRRRALDRHPGAVRDPGRRQRRGRLRAASSTSRPSPGNSAFLPFGWEGVLYALPFAMWFFLGIEELPLAAEEAHDPAKDIPRAGIIGLLTLVRHAAPSCSFLNPAVTGSGGARRARRAAPRRVPGLPVRRLGGRAVALRAGRPAGQPAGDHVRLRPQHVLALPCRLLPEVPVADGHAADAVGRAGRRRRHRLRRAACSSTQIGATRRAGDDHARTSRCGAR